MSMEDDETPRYTMPPAGLKALLAFTGLSEEESLVPERLRDFVNANAANLKKPDVLRESHILDVDDHQITLTTVRPPGTQDQKLPVIIYYHGGGFLMGNVDTHSLLSFGVCLRAQAVVVHVDYSMTPAKYPTALNECYAALGWVLDHADLIGADISKLVIMGDSAGGNLATSVTALAKDRGVQDIKVQVLLYPMLGLDFQTKSYETHKNNLSLPRYKMKYLWQCYLTEEAKTDRFAVPQLATKEDLQGLPPTLVLSCEIDPLRDDSERYIQQLREAGVETVGTRYFDQLHCFITNNPTLSLPAELAITQIAEFIKQILSRDAA
ncbi:hypothetical protein DM01DRAFT_1340887 [Hesseltinella vesiculosa]|uniref:Alpha/beta hydrolase fold-3 domain-containing protein n=1 Tax=Hesseltinella vesiculosa TaxID=101127 RepID=A0A1X2G2M7_9FUNG|nr:hypothetical protein DM01DRAFT_1340887 [Hesseltinella vesiculosa]